MAALAGCTRNCWRRWADDSVPAWIPLVAAVDEVAPAGRADAGAGPRGRVAVPAIAGLAQAGHSTGPVAGPGRGTGRPDDYRLIPGRLLRHLDSRAARLPRRAAQSRDCAPDRPGTACGRDDRVPFGPAIRVQARVYRRIACVRRSKNY